MSRLFHVAILFVIALVIATKLTAQESNRRVDVPLVITNVVQLVKELQASHPKDLLKDSAGRVYQVTLCSRWANDHNLKLLGNLDSLRGLMIVSGNYEGGATNDFGGHDFEILTEQGFAALGRNTNLISLDLHCAVHLPKNIFREVCSLIQLSELRVVASPPPAAEYSCITNLQNLEVLRLAWCPNFTDQELSYITNLTKLKSLTLQFNGLSKGPTNILRDMPSLTNVVFMPWTY